MIKVVNTEQFNTAQWKNGQGDTTELAISPGGKLDDFDWRISIATMTESGEFSTFKGYQRHLLLLSGSGLKLEHDKAPSDILKPMEVASFDGGNHTVGDLVDGVVQNFNVMTKQKACSAAVNSHEQSECFDVLVGEVLFAYAVKSLFLIGSDNEDLEVSEGCLVHISNHKGSVDVAGSAYIVVRIKGLKKVSL